tara:strand:+ start:1875 stop:2048 length:174 start_codon:yes stop_codon:yes gene_type:complete
LDHQGSERTEDNPNAPPILKWTTQAIKEDRHSSCNPSQQKVGYDNENHLVPLSEFTQ